MAWNSVDHLSEVRVLDSQSVMTSSGIFEVRTLGSLKTDPEMFRLMKTQDSFCLAKDILEMACVPTVQFRLIQKEPPNFPMMPKQ
jgi:hypothetical protein